MHGRDQRACGGPPETKHRIFPHSNLAVFRSAALSRAVHLLPGLGISVACQLLRGQLRNPVFATVRLSKKYAQAFLWMDQTYLDQEYRTGSVEFEFHTLPASQRLCR